MIRVGVGAVPWGPRLPWSAAGLGSADVCPWNCPGACSVQPRYREMLIRQTRAVSSPALSLVY